jgi:PilZ domain
MISVLDFASICGVITLTAAGASQGLHCLRRSRGQRSNPQIGLANEETSGRPAAGAWHEPRYAKRHAVSCPIEYVLGEARYEGRLVDMSRRGWRAQGRHPVATGTPMMLQILGSDPAQCVTIDEVVVRWTDGLEFGVEVTRISPDSAARLSDYLTRHYPPEEPAPVYALSPFSYN